MEKLDKATELVIGYVIYQPEEELSARIDKLVAKGYCVYLFDNSPDHAFIRDRYRNSSSVNYFTAGKNVGLGFGLSVICAHAYYDGCASLLFFDQDTRIADTTLSAITGVYKNFKIEFAKYAILIFNAKSLGKPSMENAVRTVDKIFVISSGSLFNLQVLKQLNWHNHNFFVDGVDYEFCLRARIKGYLIGEYAYTPGFDHVTGQADKLYRIWGKQLMLRAYNRRRILDALSAYSRLMAASIQHFNMRYFYLVLRSCMIYVFFQVLVRILNITK